MKTLHLLILIHFGWFMSLHGQGASRLSTPSSDSKKQLEQAAERLRAAQKSGELDRAKTTAKELLKNLPPGVTDAAKAALQTPEARAQAIEAAKAAAGSALPQVQGMIGGQTASPPPAEAAPASAPAPPAVQDQPPPAPSGPAPGALPPLTPSTTAKGTPTIIIESDRSDFDLNTAVFIYSGHVRARHPDFYIECEELEVHMVKEESVQAKNGQPPAPRNPFLTKNDKKDDKAPPIKKAIARGPMVIIEKRSLEGDIQQGRCKRLDYDGASKEITLSDYPQVQKGNVLHIATTADTVMIFDKEGRLRTNGRPRTVILSDDQPGTPNNGQ